MDTSANDAPAMIANPFYAVTLAFTRLQETQPPRFERGLDSGKRIHHERY
jgi:hypothetical protein